MHLKRTQRSRLKSQWRFLSNQLRRLAEKGKFQQLSETKKLFLEQRLKQLFQKMLRFEKASVLKKALGTAVLLLGLQLSPVHGQVTFGPTQFDPFGLTHSENLAWHALADIDGDGDLDLITVQTDYTSGGDADQTFNFQENMSTNEGTMPNFAAPVQNYGGLILPDLNNFTYNNPEFGDLDGDGDLDLLIGAYEDNTPEGFGLLFYFENTGDENNPMFAEPVTNPFNIDLNGSTTSIPRLVDLDDDGDLDYVDILAVDGDSNVLVYFENTGTANAPDYAAGQESPFGFPAGDDNLSLIDFGDIDNDGDIDVISGGIYNFYGYEPTAFTYAENIGTAETPSFAPTVSNPFSLEPQGGFIVWPILGDLDNDGDLDLLTDGGYDYDSYSASWTYQENQLDPVAVQEPRLTAQARVYPSISTGLANIQVETETVQSYFQLSIINMKGELLNQQQLSGGIIMQQQVDLSNYPSGQYLLQVRTPEGILVRKVIRS